MGAIMALHDLGHREEFEARFSHFRDEDGEVESVARIYAWIGDNDRAFEWLDKTIEVHGPDVLASIDSDLYAKIKSDPRWRSMRDKYGYFDTPVEAVEFTYSLPPGASIN